MGELIVFLIAIVMIVVVINAQQSLSTSEKNKTLEKSEVMKEQLGVQGDLLLTSFVNYCGGHPKIGKNCLLSINIYEDKILLFESEHSRTRTINTKDNPEKILLESDKIKSVEMIDQSQIVNNPKLSSIALFGLAGFAINNKENKQSYYTKIIYNYNGKDINILFGSDIEKHMGNALTELIADVDPLNRTSNIISKINFISTYQNDDANIENIQNNYTEQIRNLANLKDEGILTEEEFQVKKKVLLDKIN